MAMRGMYRLHDLQCKHKFLKAIHLWAKADYLDALRSSSPDNVFPPAVPNKERRGLE
jgi:hypothetical protein